MMNLVGLMGRLVIDPELKIIKIAEKEVVSVQYRIAVERDYKKNDKRPVDYFVCKVYGGKAQYAKEYFHKGDTVVVDGSIYTFSYKKEGESTLNIFTYIHVKNNYLAKRRGSEQTRNRTMNPIQDGQTQGEGSTEYMEEDYTDLPALPEEELFIPDITDIPFR